MEAPILYLIFNRPEETSTSFSILKRIKPKKIYIAADGPRLDVVGEEEICNEVRDLVVNNIDWECEVHTLFRDVNLGCGKAVQGALDWFFENEERGIILEDDVLPDESFFVFVNEMLEKYKNDKRIFSINGCNLGYVNKNYSYGFTRYFNMWGWATWKRTNQLVKKSWNEYNRVEDFKPNSPIINSLKLNTIWPLDEWYSLWITNIKNTHNGHIDTWDYQWSYTCLKNELYCIRPNVNLVSNIGFNENATHTKDMKSLMNDQLNTSKMVVLLQKELSIDIDSNYEIKFVAEKWQHIKINYMLFINKVFNKIKKLF